MTRQAWLAAHSYLQPLADLQSEVERALAATSHREDAAVDWQSHDDDFANGVPLLQGHVPSVDVPELASAVVRVLSQLSLARLPGAMAEQCHALTRELNQAPHDTRETISTLLAHGRVNSAHPGLLRYLMWRTAARTLRQLTTAFAAWRDEERWLRNYCPTCGAMPAMAQLTGKDPGRLRLLSCGCCETRWRYRRTGCPFCERKDDHRLTIVGVEGEGGLRLDYCDACDGYLKTYDGEGSECLLMADWTSLHLDLLARGRGLKRLAASLYDV